MLDVQKRTFAFLMPDEAQFVQTDDWHEEGDKPEAQYRIVVHPWERDREWGTERQVFIAVGNLAPDGQQDIDIEDGAYVNIILDRDEFVEGLLAVFPELTRKEQ